MVNKLLTKDLDDDTSLRISGGLDEMGTTLTLNKCTLFGDEHDALEHMLGEAFCAACYDGGCREAPRL